MFPSTLDSLGSQKFQPHYYARLRALTPHWPRPGRVSLAICIGQLATCDKWVYAHITNRIASRQAIILVHTHSRPITVRQTSRSYITHEMCDSQLRLRGVCFTLAAGPTLTASGILSDIFVSVFKMHFLCNSLRPLTHLGRGRVACLHSQSFCVWVFI